jgi:hypothetical protein
MGEHRHERRLVQDGGSELGLVAQNGGEGDDGAGARPVDGCRPDSEGRDESGAEVRADTGVPVEPPSNVMTYVPISMTKSSVSSSAADFICDPTAPAAKKLASMYAPIASRPTRAGEPGGISRASGA